jgi:hypothetical protein
MKLEKKALREVSKKQHIKAMKIIKREAVRKVYREGAPRDERDWAAVLELQKRLRAAGAKSEASRP